MNRITRAIVGIVAALALVVGIPLSASAAKPTPTSVQYTGTVDGSQITLPLTEDGTTYVRLNTTCTSSFGGGTTTTEWVLVVGTMPRKPLTLDSLTVGSPGGGYFAQPLALPSAPVTVNKPGTYTLGTTQVPVVDREGTSWPIPLQIYVLPVLSAHWGNGPGPINVTASAPITGVGCSNLN